MFTCFISRCVNYRALHSFPTRRSSDLSIGRPRDFKIMTMQVVEVLDFRLSREGMRLLNTWEVSSEPRERSEEHTSELQSRRELVCRLLLEKKNVNERLGESLRFTLDLS